MPIETDTEPQQHLFERYFARYQAIIPDWQALLASVQKPLMPCCWANPLKITGQQLRQLLCDSGFEATPIPWHPAAFRIENNTSSPTVLGRSWLYLSGLLQIQEEVSMLAGHLLEARPGELILDLCAAPGNKSAQIAVAMENSGTLIANDRQYQRLRALGQMQKRLGLMNMSCTVYDGSHYPLVDACFDRVLVDAPCSCEGTSRKHRLPMLRDPNFKRLASLQSALLAQAIALTRPGGRIIYSTCTYAPEENEAVVNRALQDFSTEVDIEPMNVDSFTSSEGLTSWQGEHFSNDLKHCMRIWPHQNDSGGFFIACLKKKTKAAASSSRLKITTNETVTKETVVLKSKHSILKKAQGVSFAEVPLEVRDAFMLRFAFNEAIFLKYRYHATARGWYMLDAEHRLPEGLRHDASGLFLMKSRCRFPKMTTTAAMLFGHQAKRHRVVLQQQQVNQYVQGAEIDLATEQMLACDSGGYVMVLYEGLCLGVGLLRFMKAHTTAHTTAHASDPDDHEAVPIPRLQSLFPQSWQGGAAKPGKK